MTMASRLLTAAGGGVDKLYVDDVFSAYTYTGNGATQTITNGIDLAGKGGLVWAKSRSAAGNGHHAVYDTARGVKNRLITNLTNGQDTDSSFLSAFNSGGFSLASASNENVQTYISWTFRKAPKFFDVVTYTGDGGTNRVLNHALGIAPGMIIIKRTDSTSDWAVWCRTSSTSSASGISLNTTDSAGVSSGGSLNQYDTVFVANNIRTYAGRNDSTSSNVNGATYVAYLFAHDPSADGIIQCGSFTTDGSGTTTVNLGWEPQYLMFKNSSGTADNWKTYDVIRGFNLGTDDRCLYPNTSSAEASNSNGNPTSTGFTAANLAASAQYIYLAIRRPNKPPTTGTQVYNAIARTGTGAAASITGVGFAPDLVISNLRVASNPLFVDRLRGPQNNLLSWHTSNEAGLASYTQEVLSFEMDGVKVGTSTAGYTNTTSPIIHWFFKRAPGVFDEVCYTGTGAATTIAHGLGVAPELMIVKCRTGSFDWVVYSATTGATYSLLLNTTAGAAGPSSNYWNNTAPTASVFTVNAQSATNFPASTSNYVAYLFATKAGISKVGSYTGNGSSQTINCGFTTGARFFLVKATSTTGSWWIFDSVRGIISAADPALQINSTAAEITSADAVDPHASGLIINQEATCSINASGVSYIYLALS